MRIELLINVPVGSEHGMTKGRILEATIKLGNRSLGLPPVRSENDDEIWVEGDTGEEVKLHNSEYRIVEE